ncbi:Transposase_IS4 [Hexamita inflata]|uniref:Transposase IS4 n=1 Tax=Hexamita inflata TaxID=28002 RepID=A0AA86ULS0_9EUKA|nr:Transposase IS4 [Hexamita inflata]CAI9956292.1 Transposase IS4 [Hexamita inflata]
MIYNKSKYVDEPQKMQAFTSAREIPREQPEIVRYYNNNYKGVDYVDQLTSSIKYPGRCTRWTTRMFIYFMQMILVNGYSLMKIQHPDYKDIDISDYVKSIIIQMQINLRKYQTKASPRKIDECNIPFASPKGLTAYNHQQVKSGHGKCISCKQCWTTHVCSCRQFRLCDECYKAHVSEMKTYSCYRNIPKRK